MEKVLKVLTPCSSCAEAAASSNGIRRAILENTELVICKIPMNRLMTYVKNCRFVFFT